MSTNRLDFKTTEDELNLLYGIINSFKDAVVVLNPAFKIIFLNKPAKLLYGLEPSQRPSDQNDQPDGLFFPDRITPCSLSELPLLNAESNDANAQIELYVQRPDGSGNSVSAACRTLPGQDGDELGWLVTLTDITLQKQREHVLRQSVEHHENAAMIANIGSWSWDAVNDKVYWSDELYRIFGLDPQSPAPSYSEHQKFYTPESFARLNHAVQTALSTGLPYELDLNALHADGSIRTLIARGQVKRNLADQIVGLKGITIDISNRKCVDEQEHCFSVINNITKRKKIKQKLTDVDAFNASVLNSLTANIAVIDAQGIITATNDAWRQFARENGFPEASQSMLGVNYLDVCTSAINQSYGEEAYAAQTGIKGVLSGELESYHLVYPCHSPHKHRWFQMNVTRLKGLNNSAVVSHENITDRRHAEDSLRATLASLRAVFDNLPFLAWMKDREGRYLLANKLWSQAVGLDDPINLDGITDYDIWPKELAEHYRLVDQQVMASRQQVLLTEKALDEGRETWTETIKAPIIDDKDEVLGTMGIARDITDSLIAEQQLHKSSERLRLASKAAAIGICEWNVSTGLAEWDERNYEIFGISQGTPIDYRTWAKLVLPDDLPNAIIKIRKLLQKKQEIHWDFRIHRQSDGALRYIKSSAIPACKPNGEVHKIIGVNLDVTDFKQIEIELDEKRAHLSEAQALGNLGSWSLDLETNKLKWSDENYRIFGIAIGTQLNYESFLTMVHPGDRAYADSKWTEALQGEPYDIQLRILVDSKVKWIRRRAILEFASDGSLLRAVGTSQDITELKLIESDLETSRLQLRQLAARRERTREEERKRIARDIHDELGQMLTSLRMEISLLRMNFARDNSQLLECIQSITRLLDNTIQVTREVATKLRPTVIEMGIGPALEWLVKTTSLQTGIEFDISYSESDLNLDDEAAIVVFRIVQESINNVLKHAQASKVTISMKLESDNYVLEIDDNGKGFDIITSRKDNSLGLISRQERAIMLGGKANISSTSGKGTLIQVTIPMCHLGQSR